MATAHVTAAQVGDELIATRAKLAQHPIEEVGAKLRDMMPWIKKGALVDKSKN